MQEVKKYINARIFQKNTRPHAVKHRQELSLFPQGATFMASTLAKGSLSVIATALLIGLGTSHVAAGGYKCEFDSYDANKDGFIDPKEGKAIFSDDAFKKADTDKDGKLSFSEFVDTCEKKN